MSRAAPARQDVRPGSEFPSSSALDEPEPNRRSRRPERPPGSCALSPCPCVSTICSDMSGERAGLRESRPPGAHALAPGPVSCLPRGRLGIPSGDPFLDLEEERSRVALEKDVLSALQHRIWVLTDAHHRYAEIDHRTRRVDPQSELLERRCPLRKEPARIGRILGQNPVDERRVRKGGGRTTVL